MYVSSRLRVDVRVRPSNGKSYRKKSARLSRGEENRGVIARWAATPARALVP